MSRAVIFKTKSKLDLRSLTVFGMNSKPNTINPIGYFGTGLKYAVAVLSRERIPVTFWIDGKKWTVEQDDTKFRDKEFRALSLKRHSMIPKTINLPFTTELGKNWDLWQAFRELESNTRDEKGETFIDDTGQLDNPEHPIGAKGLTYIAVESEKFVQEYFDREKTFLPEGMTERNSSESVQCFLRKSNHIYYRSIRIMDLKEPSENTYNILSQIELTEDRTAKSEILVRWEIEKYLANHAPKEIAVRAIKAPAKSYERRLDYSYTSKSDEFLDTVKEAGDEATPDLQTAYREARPVKPTTTTDWRIALITHIREGEFTAAASIIHDHRETMITILERDLEEHEPDDVDDQLPVGTDEPTLQETSEATTYGKPNWKEPENDATRSTGSIQRVDQHGDDIPF